MDEESDTNSVNRMKPEARLARNKAKQRATPDLIEGAMQNAVVSNIVAAKDRIY